MTRATRILSTPTRVARAALLVLGLFPALIGCGSGGGSTTPPPAPPTLTVVAPPGGTSLGGTALTLTGTNFAAGATVTVGGTAATGIVLVDPTTITCVTPPGTPGAAVDVAVTTGGETPTLPGAFAYAPLPTLTNIVLARGSTGGGTAVTLTGTGFEANAAGSNSVMVGGAPATGVTTVSDTSITCTTPPGTAGAAAVVVTNANGAALSVGGFTYVVPTLYGASGGGYRSEFGGSGWLYTVDTTSGLATLVGEIGFQITAMDFASDGTLYAATAIKQGTSQLIRIDTTTGAGTAVGPLLDGATEHDLRGLAWVGSRMLGAVGVNLFEVDVTTGALTTLSTSLVGNSGEPLASNATGSALYRLGGAFGNRPVTSIDPVTYARTAGPNITGLAGPISKAAAYLEGVLYAIDGGGDDMGSPAVLVTLDPTTGAGTPIGTGTGAMLDALAGTVK